MKKKINRKNIINLLKLNFRISGFILKKGKLSKASLILDNILLLLIKSSKINPFIVINKAIKNVSPLFLLKNKKYGKRVVINPIFIVSSFTRTSLGIKWIIEAAFRRTGNFYNNLFLEILNN
jgi:ribosomal protein S7